MMERSNASRHIWGGALGGILGIIFCAIFSPMFIFPGCLIGVVLGYFGDMLWQTAVSTQRKIWATPASPALFWTVFSTLITVLSLMLTPVIFILLKICTFLWWLTLIIRKPVAWVISMNASPATKAQMGRLFARGALTCINLPIIIGLFAIAIFNITADHSDIPSAFGYGIMCGIVACSHIMLLGIFEISYERSGTIGERLLKEKETRRGKYGVVVCFLLDVAQFIIVQAVIIIAAIIASLLALLAAALAVSYMGVVILPWLLIVVGVHGIYLMTDKKYASGLCLATTLVITAVTAWYCRGYLTGAPLYLVALWNGTLCAFIGEGIRRGIIMCAEKTFLHRIATEPISNIVRPTYTWVTKNMG